MLKSALLAFFALTAIACGDHNDFAQVDSSTGAQDVTYCADDKLMFRATRKPLQDCKVEQQRCSCNPVDNLGMYGCFCTEAQAKP